MSILHIASREAFAILVTKVVKKQSRVKGEQTFDTPCFFYTFDNEPFNIPLKAFPDTNKHLKGCVILQLTLNLQPQTLAENKYCRRK